MATSRSRLFALEPKSPTALYRQIYDRVRGAIASGVLKPGDRMPSARALTAELGLARGTIDAAYGLLAAEGYIQARGQAGTVVSPGLKPRLPVTAPPLRSAPPAPTFRPDSVLPLQMGLPALDGFPRKIWARLAARRARAMHAADMAQPSLFGLPALRAEVATYLRLSRGIDCSQAQVFVTSGFRQTLTLVARAILKAGDRTWVEDPGYPPARSILAELGTTIVPVPVDGEGIVVQDGVRLAPRARLAVVTPAHQSPLSVSLSLPRRLALLDWATRNGSWILEDDYDGEYRYVSRPLPALKSLDRDCRVIYAGTFSKVLFPSLRLAYVVMPPELVERFEQIMQVFAGDTPELTQSIVATFITEGHFARHIQRMRKCYAERREWAIAGLADALGPNVQIDTQPGGMHLIVRFPGRWSDRRLVARMRDEGLYGEALTDWSVRGDGPAALLVSFTNVASHEAAEALGTRIARLRQ
jgi:GntR family transcriptional regulator/MocR family aminotransferase